MRDHDEIMTMIPAIEVAATQMAPPATAPPASASNHQQKQPTGKTSPPRDRNEQTDSMYEDTNQSQVTLPDPINLFEKSVLIHGDENGFGLRVKGQSPVFVDYVHENGPAWRAGVRKFDLISKVNGNSVSNLDHKQVVGLFKSCSRFVGLTLLSSQPEHHNHNHNHNHNHSHSHCSPASSTSCLHQQRQSEGNININLNQLQLHARCQAGGPNQAADQGEEATKLADQACQRLRRPILLANATTTGSARTLLGLHQPNKQQQYQFQLSGRGENKKEEQDEYRAAACAANRRQSHHKLSLISVSGRQQYHDLVATLLSGSKSRPTLDSEQPIAVVGSSDLSKQQQTSDNSNDNSRQPSSARRSESKPCHLSAPQPKSSPLTGDEQKVGQQQQQQQQQQESCICVSCRASLLGFRANSQGGADMDTCEQCRLVRSAAGFARLSYKRHPHLDELQYRSNQLNIIPKANSSQVTANRNMETTSTREGNRQAQQQQQQHPKEMLHCKLSQSASTSSLPTESQRAKTNNPNSNTNNNNNNNTGLGQDKSKSKSQEPQLAQSNQTIPRALQTNKRLEIIRELIDTEKTHTDRLRCLHELFYRPLKSGGLMTSDQLRMVFSCHRTLYKIHRQIYRILSSVNHNLYPEPLIGSALIEIFEGDLKRRLERAACNFCASQSNNADLLNKLTRRDTKVGEFLAHVTSQQMVGRLGIKDLLASCFQRLTKYPLLLENLLKATPQVPPKLPMEVASQSPLRRSRKVNNSIEGDDGSQEANSEADDDDEELDQDQEQEDDDEDEEDDEEEVDDEEPNEEDLRQKAREDSQRMMAISLAEEREFIERALNQSRQMLVRVNESVKVAFSHNKLKEIWKRTDKHPGVPVIDITKQQVVHEGLLTLRLSKRSFDVYVLLLNDYLIILTREGQDKYRLKFFTPEGKSSSNSNNNNQAGVYSPLFVIDEHLTTRDAATDENGFYLLCKRKDDSRIYEFASRSPADRSRWRDKIQWTIERKLGKSDRRRSSCESTITKSSSEISSNRDDTEDVAAPTEGANFLAANGNRLPASIREEEAPNSNNKRPADSQAAKDTSRQSSSSSSSSGGELTKIEGTISLVEDDGIIQPTEVRCSRALIGQAILVNICDRLEEPVTSS